MSTSIAKAIALLRSNPDKQTVAVLDEHGETSCVIVRDATGRRAVWEQWGWNMEPLEHGLLRAQVAIEATR